MGAAAVDGERLNREGCRRSLRASAHIGQRASDPENDEVGTPKAALELSLPAAVARRTLQLCASW